MDAVTLALIKSMAGNGGGSSLPPVTSSDNGKVLAVQDGAWAAVANTVPITFTYDDEGSDQYLSSDIISGLPDALAVSFSGGPYDLYNVVFRRIGEVSSTYPIYQGTMVVSGTYIYTYTAYVSLARDGETYRANFIDDDTIKTNKYIVTLTPTAQDFSGTMDKTVAEINAAYEAGMDIVFRVLTSATDHADFPLAFAAVIDPFTYMNFGANFFYSVANTLIVLETGATLDGTKQTYFTTVYSLTPAS